MKLVALIIAGMVVTGFVVAQAPQTIRNFTESNGLPSSEVYQIFQDRQGFIWFATDNGVAKFDGEDFEIFNKSNGLPDQVVFGFYEDKNGRIWFRTFSGLTSVYEDSKLTTYQFNDKLKALTVKSVVYSMAIDSLGRLCFASTRTASIDSAGRTEVEDNPHAYVFFKEVDDGAYLVGYNSASHSDTVSINGKKYFIHFEPNTSNSAVVPCYRFWKGKLFISIDRNLFQYDGHSLSKVFASWLPIISLSVDRHDQFWIGYLNGGVDRYAEPAFTEESKTSFFAGKSVTTVYQDMENGYWFSTLDKGAYYMPNPSLVNYGFEDEKKVSIVVDDNEAFYLGNYLGELKSIDFKTKSIRWVRNLQQPVMALSVIGPRRNIWASTTAGTFLISNEGTVLKKFQNVQSIKSFCEDSRGFVWCVNQMAIFKFSAQGDMVIKKSIPFWPRSIMVEGNRVWIAKVAGLALSDTLLSDFRDIDEFRNFRVSRMMKINENEILVGTVGNGLHLIKEGKSFGPKGQSLVTFASIYDMVRDDSSFWFGTENGLVKAMLGPQGLRQSGRLSQASGLLADKVSFLASNKTEVLAFSDKGYTVVPKSNKTFTNLASRFYFKSVTVNNKPVSFKGAISLLHTENNIRISFGLINYNNRQYQVRHRLDRSQTWNAADGSSISYYALPPGNYHPQIEYSTDGESWTPVDFPGTFWIASPWWNTLYFRFFSLALIILGIYSAFVVTISNMKKEKEKELNMQNVLREQRERIAKDLHDNIGTHLTSISLGLHDLDKGKEQDLVRILQEDVHATMTELRDTIWAMNQREITVDQLCDKLKNLAWRLGQRNGTSVTCETSCSEDAKRLTLQPAQAINIFRILQEAISNAQKHSGPGSILIALDELSPGKLRFTVSDKGRGFSLGENSIPDHFGLDNMRKRALEIDADFSMTSAPGKGTRVEVQVNVLT